MNVSKQELDQWLDVCGECARIQVSPKQKDFYFRNLKNINATKLADAINLYGVRGHFPTVQELLVECGYFAPKSNAEREEQERRQEAIKKSEEMPEDTEKTPEKLSGDWTWFADKITPSRQEAEMFFEQVQREKLEPYKWVIRDKEIHEFWKEVTEGKRSYRAQGFKCFYHSRKEETGAQDAKIH